MQTNSRLFTDHPIHAAAQAVTNDETGAFLEGLAHLGLVLILLGAFYFSAQRASVPAVPVASPEVNVVAEAVAPAPTPVVRSL